MRLYRVYDTFDPPATDTFCRSQAEAKEAAKGFIEASKIEPVEVNNTRKEGVIDALNRLPLRVSPVTE